MSVLDFDSSVAVVIGIDQYEHGIAPLRTAVADAEAIAQHLQADHDYQVITYLNQQAQLSALKTLIKGKLPKLLTANSRLLLYFAGHGIAQDGDDGPAGYLIPQDAKPGLVDSYLPMIELHDALVSLPCRHFLAIFDCCFAGAFRWSSTRDMLLSYPVIHQERFDRFRRDPAWQVITSAAHDQTAMDIMSLKDTRGEVNQHSPFAAALMTALAGAADVSPPAKDGKPAGDGVLTATELYTYLRDIVEPQTEAHQTRQTPGLCALRNHGKGEFIFLTPGHALNLPPAPALNKQNNPYQGLESFDTEDASLFYGREALVDDLSRFIKENSFTAVLGASGIGKSSLVKAGLIPALRDEANENWHILPVMRPGESPLKALAKVVLSLDSDSAHPQQVEALSAEIYESPRRLLDRIRTWKKAHLDQQLLLVIDQFEEVVTLCKQPQVRQQLFDVLRLGTIAKNPLWRVVITLRADFEPQFLETPLRSIWMTSRFMVPPMSREDLRRVIEQPAMQRVLYFDPPRLVERLLDDVNQTPGALPLLSFTLSELYLCYLMRKSDDRALTEADYEALGGIAGSLTQRATKEYRRGVEIDSKYEHTLRNIALRMVSFEGGELARRRVPDTELVYASSEENQRVHNALRLLIDARLFVKGQTAIGETYVEPAHDALVYGWDKLLQWTRQAPEEMLLQQPLRLAAAAWAKNQGTLWQGDRRLGLLKDALNHDGCWLNQAETAFVRRSLQVKSRNQCLRWLGISSVILASVISGLMMKNSKQTATYKEYKAQSARASNWVSTDRAIEGLALAISTFYKSAQSPADVQVEAQKALLESARLAREQNRLIGHTASVRAIAYDPSGQYIASSGMDRKVKLWNTHTGQLIRTFNGGENAHPLSTYALAFSPDGTKVVSGGGGGTDNLKLWDVQTGNAIGSPMVGHTNTVRAVDFSSDGNRIVSASDDKMLRLWNAETAQPIGEAMSGHRDIVWSVAFSPDGKSFVSGSPDRRLIVWDTETRKPTVEPFEAHAGSIWSVDFSADGQRIVSSSSDRTIRLWNAKTGDPLGWPMGGHRGEVYSAKFGINDRTIISTGADQTIWTWNIATLSQADIISNAHNNIIWAIALSEDGKQIASASSDNTIRLWDQDVARSTGQIQSTGHSESVLSVALSADGKQFATASQDKAIRLWDTVSGLSIGKTLTGHRSSVRSVVFHPNGKWLFSASSDKSIWKWDLTTGKRIGEPWGDGASDIVYSIAISPNGDRLVSGGKDRMLRLWDTQTGELIGEPWQLHKDWIYSVAFSYDGKYVASGSRDNSVIIWDALTGQPMTPPLVGHTNDVWSVAFSPSDRYIASSSSDETIRFWDTQTGEAVGPPLKGHNSSVWSVAFSPDGSQLASGSNDRTIRLWDVSDIKNAKPIGPPLEGHTASVWSVLFTQDGESVLSGSADLGLRRWPSRLEQWPELACDRLKNHPFITAPETLIDANDEPLPKEELTISKDAKAACHEYLNQ